VINENWRVLKKASEFLLVATIMVLIGSNSKAVPSFKSDSLNGHLGAGLANFKINNPKLDFNMDQGLFGTLGAEKSLPLWNFYLSLSFDYTKTEGSTRYRFETLMGKVYAATSVKFKSEIINVNLGLKLKLLDGTFIQPFLEGGGSLGYYKMDYSFSSSNLAEFAADDGNHKKQDSLLAFGSYVEGGMELAFSQGLGIRLAARLMKGQTKELDTLDNEKIEYEAQIYYFTLILVF